MAEDGQERAERATPKRLEEARKQGQIPRSSELNAATVVFTTGVGLHFLGGSIGGQLHGLMRSSLTLTREQSLDETLMINTVGGELLHALIACAPLLGL